MKRNLLFGAFLLTFVSLFLFSCNKDEESSAPTITVTPTDDTIFVVAGETVQYQIGITSADDLISVKYTAKIGSDQQILLDSTLAKGIKSFNQNINLLIPATLPVGTVSMFSVFAATSDKSAIVDRIIQVKNPPVAPVVTVTPADDVIAFAGETVVYEFAIASEDDLTTVKVTHTIEGTEVTLFDTTFAAGTKSVNKNVNVTIPASTPTGITTNLKFTANTALKTTTVERNIAVVPNMGVYTNVELKAQADGPASAGVNLSFYSTGTNESFNYTQANTAEASALIDLVFTHHSIYKNSETNAEMSFQSPNAQNLVTMWNNLPAIPFAYNAANKKQTYFKVLTTVDWDNLDYNGIDAAVGTIGTLSILRGINNDDFIGFQTAEGKKGIIKVVATNPIHNPYTDATITFDVKVQK